MLQYVYLKLDMVTDKISSLFSQNFDQFLFQDKSGEFVSVLQCHSAPSSRTPRGHQYPAAFMMQVIFG